MAIPKEASESINFNALGKRISAIDEVFKNQEFQKLINQLASKSSSSDIESFVNSELEPEALTKRGIEVPKGTKIVFKPSKEGAAASQKKKLVVSLTIPEVGTIAFRSGLKDKPEKTKE